LLVVISQKLLPDRDRRLSLFKAGGGHIAYCDQTEIFISELIAACLAINGIDNPNLLAKWRQH